MIDGIVPEPEGGAQVDHDAAAVLLREALVAHLDELDGRARGRAAARTAGEVPLDGRPRVGLSPPTRLSTLSTGLSPTAKRAFQQGLSSPFAKV